MTPCLQCVKNKRVPMEIIWNTFFSNSERDALIALTNIPHATRIELQGLWDDSIPWHAWPEWCQIQLVEAVLKLNEVK